MHILFKYTGMPGLSFILEVLFVWLVISSIALDDLLNEYFVIVNLNALDS